MATVGQQTRQKIESTGYRLLGTLRTGSAAKMVILEDADTGRKELWVLYDNHPGFVVEIDGKGYAFVREALLGDLWWAGLSSD